MTTAQIKSPAKKLKEPIVKVDSVKIKIDKVDKQNQPESKDKQKIDSEKYIIRDSKIVVHPYKGKEGGLGEIMQSVELKAAVLKKNPDGTFTRQTTFFRCLDFFSDAYASAVEKVDFGIYGFSFKGATEEVDWTGLHAYLRFPTKDARDSFYKNLHFVHEVEQKNNIPFTVFHEIGELEVVTESNKAWLHNCITLRLLLLIFRVCCFPLKSNDWVAEMSAGSWTDSAYIKSVHPSVWERMLNNLEEVHTLGIFSGLSISESASGYHHSSGIISSCGGWHSEISMSWVKKNKIWQILKERGFILNNASKA